MNQEHDQPIGTEVVDCMRISELPAIDSELCDGTFAGAITLTDGTHVAVILLPERAEDINWPSAMDWAQSLGGQLPTRPMAAVIYANVKNRPQSGFFWTCETHKADASCAWFCYFGSGNQNSYHRSYRGTAVAVRTIPLSA
jgi:hypothetical protein